MVGAYNFPRLFVCVGKLRLVNHRFVSNSKPRSLLPLVRHHARVRAERLFFDQ